MITFNDGELERLEVAVRLRVEACNENDEPAEARRWQRLLDKLHRGADAHQNDRSDPREILVVPEGRDG